MLTNNIIISYYYDVSKMIISIHKYKTSSIRLRSRKFYSIVYKIHSNFVLLNEH